MFSLYSKKYNFELTPMHQQNISIDNNRATITTIITKDAAISVIFRLYRLRLHDVNCHYDLFACALFDCHMPVYVSGHDHDTERTNARATTPMRHNCLWRVDNRRPYSLTDVKMLDAGGGGCDGVCVHVISNNQHSHNTMAMEMPWHQVRRKYIAREYLLTAVIDSRTIPWLGREAMKHCLVLARKCGKYTPINSPGVKTTIIHLRAITSEWAARKYARSDQKEAHNRQQSRTHQQKEDNPVMQAGCLLSIALPKTTLLPEPPERLWSTGLLEGIKFYQHEYVHSWPVWEIILYKLDQQCGPLSVSAAETLKSVYCQKGCTDQINSRGRPTWKSDFWKCHRIFFCVLCPTTAGLDPQYTHVKKLFPEQTRRATANTRLLLTSSRQGETSSACYIFVWSIFDLFST